MKLDFLTVLINISVLMLLGVPGYIFRKKKIIGEKDTKPLVVLLIYITQPFLILMSFQGKQYTQDILGSMGWVFGLTLFIHLVMLFIAKMIFSKTAIDKKKKGVFIFASAFSNCGYIGIPVISSLFKDYNNLSEMLIYVSIYIAVFNLVNWTIGIYIISGDKKYISIKNAVVNPTTIALFVALPLFFLKISLFEIFVELADAFKMFGDMTTPLSMTILGIKLAEMPLREIFISGHVYLTSFIKLILMPLLLLGIIKLLTGYLSLEVIYVLIIISAMPTATLTVANTERFGGDSYAAAKILLCSTLLSVISLPLICTLL